MAKMKAEDVKVDLNELKEFKKKNFQDRLKFIDFWVDYMKRHSDEEWSKHQAVLIDGQYEMAGRFWDNFKEDNRKKNTRKIEES